jgi:hypothetical protein
MVLQVLAPTRDAEGGRLLRKTGGDAFDPRKEQLFAFSCLDFDRDGKRDYVVTTVGEPFAAPGPHGPPAAGNGKRFTFRFFDAGFRRGRDALKLEFDPQTVAMPEDFRWLAVSGKELMPTFVARGRKPQAELPADDPWEKRPADVVNPLDQRLYYVDRAGLHTLAPPEGYRLADLLKPTRRELRDGSATALVFKGTDFVLDFYAVKLTGKSWGVPQKLDFSIYQKLAGLKGLPVMRETAPDPAIDASGVAYAEEGAAGRLRVSVEALDPAARVLPWLLEPVKPGDFLTQLVAVFGSSAEQAQAFARSRFQLYFFDRARNLALGTDLKQYDSVTRHLAALVEGRPAMLLPEGQGSELASEVILPRLDLSGAATVLARPASLKTLGANGCELIQMKSTGANGAGGGANDPVRKLEYFCGEHFVEIAL